MPKLEGIDYRHPATRAIAKFFDYEHLSGHAGAVSELCYELAGSMIDELNDGPELTAGLRKLLEAKDCFVRQVLLDEGRV